MNKSNKAVLFTVITAILWSSSGVFIKLIEWDYLAIVCGRSFFTAIVMWLLIRKQRIVLSPAVIGGAIAYAAFQYCIIVSTKLTTSANAVMMQYTAPVYVALLSGLLLKEKVFAIDWICMAAVIFGMLLFFMDSTGGGSFIGNVVAIGNGLSFAMIAICLRLQREGNPEQSVFIGAVLATVIGIPFAAKAGMPSMNSALLIAVGGIIVGVAYGLYSNATKNLNALQAVLIPVIDPVLNPVWVFLTIGEKPGLISLIGALVVLVAVTGRAVLIVLESKKQKV